MIRLFATCVLFMCAVLAWSCAPISRPGVERTHYLLQAQRPKTGTHPAPLDMVLAVRTVRVASGFDSKAFVTKYNQGRAKADFHHQFFLPPGEMLTLQVRTWLTDAGLFATVTDLRSLLAPDLILESVVSELSLDASGKTPRAVLALQFLLLSPGQDRPAAVLLQRDYQSEVDLERISPWNLVRGWNNALETILTDFEADLRQALASAQWAAQLPVRDP